MSAAHAPRGRRARRPVIEAVITRLIMNTEKVPLRQDVLGRSLSTRRFPNFFF